MADLPEFPALRIFFWRFRIDFKKAMPHLHCDHASACNNVYATQNKLFSLRLDSRVQFSAVFRDYKFVASRTSILTDIPIMYWWIC